MLICAAIDCDTQAKARGLCDKHWKRWRNGKDVNEKSVYEKTDIERLLSKANVLGEDDCWIWHGGTRGRGLLQYGAAWHKGRHVGAHRLSWALHNGEIPPHTNGQATEVCHKCDTPLCINPNHLFLGSHTDNMRDKISKGRCGQKSKTHCPQGHSYDEHNTYVSKRGIRFCKTCLSTRNKARKLKLKQQKEEQNGTHLN